MLSSGTGVSVGSMLSSGAGVSVGSMLSSGTGVSVGCSSTYLCHAPSSQPYPQIARSSGSYSTRFTRFAVLPSIVCSFSSTFSTRPTWSATPSPSQSKKTRSPGFGSYSPAFRYSPRLSSARIHLAQLASIGKYASGTSA